jgi:hypothetical protein
MSGSEYPPQILSNESLQAIALQDTVDCCREGNLLVMRIGTRTPDRCVYCNTDAGGFRVTRKYAEQVTSTTTVAGADWVSGILALFSLLLVIAELAARKTGRVHLALCPRHRRIRRRRTIMGWMLMVGALGLMIGGTVIGIIKSDWDSTTRWTTALLGGVPGLILFFVGVAIVARAQTVLSAKKISKSHLWLERAGEGFLATLPRRSVQTEANN